MPKIEDHILLTYPRSGSKYLTEIIEQTSGIRLISTHDINKTFNKKIITIIRNPLDTIKSKATMQRNFGQYKDLKEYADGYCKTYDHLIINANLIIKYEDLISNNDLLIEFLFDYLKITNNNIKYSSILKDSKDYNYLVSSKTSSLYESVPMDTINLDLCNKYYQECKDKSININ
jgi:hypothetical protein